MMPTVYTGALQYALPMHDVLAGAVEAQVTVERSALDGTVEEIAIYGIVVEDVT